MAEPTNSDPGKDLVSRVTHRILLRILRGQKFTIVSTSLAFIAAAVAIVVAVHLGQQVGDLKVQNNQQKIRQKDLDAEVKNNHQSGLTTRGIVCETLKAVDALAWSQNKDCRALPSQPSLPAIGK